MLSFISARTEMRQADAPFYGNLLYGPTEDPRYGVLL